MYKKIDGHAAIGGATSVLCMAVFSTSPFEEGHDSL